MNDDILKTIEPKSDQLNADSLLGRTLTITVKKVTVSEGGKGDQPVTVYFDGDEGRPYKPGKSMRRVLVFVWGPDTGAWVGRSMTIYRDEHVLFAGAEVGGIRISHMSGIKNEVTLALTASRSNRKPFTVHPLTQRGRAGELLGQLNDMAARAETTIEHGHRAAEKGMAALSDFWRKLPPDQKRDAGGAAQLESWKRTAADADRGGLTQDENDFVEGALSGVKAEANPPQSAHDAVEPASEIKASPWGNGLI
jgi:hypothetical protein